MSTHAHVGFEGGKVLVWRHHDGAPRGMLRDLVPFVQEQVPNEPGILEALLCGLLQRQHCGKAVGPYGAGTTVLLDVSFYNEAPYLYVVRRDRTIEILDTSGDGFDSFVKWKGKAPRNARQIATIPAGVTDPDEAVLLACRIQEPA